MSWLSPEVIEGVSKFGWGVLVFALLVIVVKHVLKQSSEILAAHQEERTQWQQTMNEVIEKNREVQVEVTKAIERNTVYSKEFHNAVKDAHGFQREEHGKLLEQNGHTATALAEVVVLLKALSVKVLG